MASLTCLKGDAAKKKSSPSPKACMLQNHRLDRAPPGTGRPLFMAVPAQQARG